MAVAFEDFEQGVQGHLPNIDIGGGRLSGLGLGLTGKSFQHLLLNTALQLFATRGNVSGSDGEDLVQYFGRLYPYCRRSVGLVENAEQVTCDDLPADSDIAIYKPVDVYNRDVSEFGDTERFFARPLCLNVSPRPCLHVCWNTHQGPNYIDPTGPSPYLSIRKVVRAGRKRRTAHRVVRGTAQIVPRHSNHLAIETTQS